MPLGGILSLSRKRITGGNTLDVHHHRAAALILGEQLGSWPQENNSIRPSRSSSSIGLHHRSPCSRRRRRTARALRSSHLRTSIKVAKFTRRASQEGILSLITGGVTLPLFPVPFLADTLSCIPNSHVTSDLRPGRSVRLSSVAHISPFIAQFYTQR